MEFSVDVGFFGFLLVAVAASTVVAAIVEFIAKGKGGKATYAFSLLASLVFVFLAHHWNRIGVWTTPDEWVRNTAIASIIAASLIISAIGSHAGKAAWAKLTDSARPDDTEESAITAIMKESDEGKLALAASNAKFYRVRSIACEKLGRHQAAKREIALYSPDEPECLAALDEVDWNGWDQTLADIAVRSDREAVALKALGKIHDDESLSEVASRSRNGAVVSAAISRIHDDMTLASVAAEAIDKRAAMAALCEIEDEDALRRLCEQGDSLAASAPVRFEAGRRLGDSGVCAAALGGILEEGADGVKTALGSIEDAGFRADVIRRWLIAAFPAEDVKRRRLGADAAPSILGKLAGRPILDPPIDEGLEGYLCPNGSVHDFASTTIHDDAGSDDYRGIVWRKTCGYRYHVDKGVYLSGEHLFGHEDNKA